MSPAKRKKNKNFKNKKPRDPHLSREKAKYGKPIASRELIISTLRKEKSPMKFDGLAEQLGINNDAEALDALTRRVRAMQRDGQLIENRKRGLVPVDQDALLAGKVSAHPDGYGFVSPERDDGKGDIYLSAKQMRRVLHGDRIVVSVTGVDRKGRREGRIVDVVDRANKSIVGRFMEDNGVSVIVPDNKRIHQDLIVAHDQSNGAERGDIVVAEILEQPSQHKPPVGKVVEVLGKHLEPGMEIDMSLRSHDIPFEWPQAVLDQANQFSTEVQDADKLGRKDVTRLPLVTIDGADARDFDDAVYCEKNGDGWRLYVAIADVAHYVSVNSPLDNEAENRGTSVYFPGRVVPMLPEVLSNGLCSINPAVERLCMLCEITLDAQGGVKRSRFYNGVMLSHARLTYSQVNELLTDESSALHNEFEEVVPHVKNLHALYKVLANNRSERGVIEFASNETRIVFDDNKKIKEIVPIVRNDAHKLIEECMILANVAAAGFLEQHSVPSLFRVHQGPKSDRLEDLRAFLSLRGLSLGGGDQPTALDYAKLSWQLTDRQDQSVISTMLLRSMQQAVYQPKNEGHFGLALGQYAHFTSPIRRYPDLLVHRAIKHVLKRDSIINYPYSADRMKALGESCSTTERRAEDASRDVVSWLKCEYMQDHIGSEFPGVISAVTSFGLFVELTDFHVEGLLHVTNLSRDYYKFEQAAQAMVGERTGKQYRLGDAIVVSVDAVNLEDRKIDFAEASGKKPKRKKGAQPPAKPVKSPKVKKPVILSSDELDKDGILTTEMVVRKKKPKKKVSSVEDAGTVSKAGSKKKTAGKKKPSTKKKTAGKKKPSTKKKTAGKKKPNTKKKTAGKKQPSTRKKTAGKKQPSTKKKMTGKKQPSAKKKTAGKKKPSAKKKPASKKKTSAKKKVSNKKKAGSKKKKSAKKKTTRKSGGRG